MKSLLLKREIAVGGFNFCSTTGQLHYRPLALRLPVQLLTQMDRLPDEVLLNIFVFLLPTVLFGSVSAVGRRFHCLAYDYSSIHRSHTLLHEINLQRKSLSSVQRLLKMISVVPSNVKYLTVQECDTTWQVFNVVATMCKELKILNLAYVKGEPRLNKEISLFAFV